MQSQFWEVKPRRFNLPTSRASLTQATKLLRAGGIVVFPTETSYGIAADARNVRAVRKVFAAKGREAGKSVPLIVSSFAMAQRVAVLAPALRALARRHWPGALTIVAPARPGAGLARGVIAADGTVAVRVSAHPVARALARRLDGPIVATSANRSGEPPCYDVAAAQAAFGARVGAYLDGGRLRPRPASTIVALRDGTLSVLRQGPVKV